jgi:hypothetical protein
MPTRLTVPSSRGDVQVALADDRQFHLADLVALGQVRVEVVLAGEHVVLADFGVNARPNITAMRTASWFSTGSTPGMPRSTRLAWVFGSEPNVVALPEKIFDWVASWE